jgi:predicted DNA-binding transcriptional regulator AlpA
MSGAYRPYADELVSVPEVAEMLGVSRQRVHQIVRAYEDFPAPVAELALGRIWNREAVADWMSSQPRSTGRPRRSSRSQASASPTASSEPNGTPSGGTGGSWGVASRVRPLVLWCRLYRDPANPRWLWVACLLVSAGRARFRRSG